MRPARRPAHRSTPYRRGEVTLLRPPLYCSGKRKFVQYSLFMSCDRHKALPRPIGAAVPFPHGYLSAARLFGRPGENGTAVLPHSPLRLSRLLTRWPQKKTPPCRRGVFLVTRPGIWGRLQACLSAARLFGRPSENGTAVLPCFLLRLSRLLTRWAQKKTPPYRRGVFLVTRPGIWGRLQACLSAARLFGRPSENGTAVLPHSPLRLSRLLTRWAQKKTPPVGGAFFGDPTGNLGPAASLSLRCPSFRPARRERRSRSPLLSPALVPASHPVGTKKTPPVGGAFFW